MPSPILPVAMVIPYMHLGPTSAVVLGLGFGTGGFLALFCVALLLRFRWSRRATAARERYQPSREMTLGETILEGTVEYEAGANHAIRVEISQDGTESENSGVWSHTWRERRRSMKVRPFFLRTAEALVRVEPDAEVRLIDEADRTVRLNLASRTRIAELTPGERVWAHGILERRELHESRDETRWVLRPGPGMEISSLPLGERARRRASNYGVIATSIALAALLWHGALLWSGYPARLVHGVSVTGEIESTEHSISHDEDGDTHIYTVTVKATEPQSATRASWTDRIDKDLHDRLERGRPIPVCIVPGGSGHQIGECAAFNVMFLITAIGMHLATIILQVVKARRPIGWFEGPLVEQGKGKLKESHQ